MTRNELYELESSVCKNIDRIKKEQAEYIKGVEYGIDLMFSAVREHLVKEEQALAERITDNEQRNTEDGK